jgi:hypothetical protein
MNSDCTAVSPLSIFQNTDLNNRMNDFGRLGDRIARALGAPMINVEIHQDQLFENISIACEMFTKYAGFTEEYLVFSSDLYERGVGIRLDQLFSITPQFKKTVKPIDTVYVAASSVPSSFFTSSSSLSVLYPSGVFQRQILTQTEYTNITAFSANIGNYFTPSSTTLPPKHENTFDYDIMDYRKVIACLDFEEGSTTGVNTLFTIEQTLAQQTYFSYSMGNYGFDLVSWQILKDWLKNREKLLAQKRYITFDPRTQYLNMTPEPGTSGAKFWGIIQCYVERPLRDIIKEQWVYQYALALSKISVGYVRGKYQGTTLFGGGTINSSLAEDGKAEKLALEEKLFSGASAGFGDAPGVGFFIG